MKNFVFIYLFIIIITIIIIIIITLSSNTQNKFRELTFESASRQCLIVKRSSDVNINVRNVLL